MRTTPSLRGELVRDIGLEQLSWSAIDELAMSEEDPRRAWLSETGSLTQKLKRERAGEFRLELIEQVSEPIPMAVAPLLDAEPDSPGHRREVMLIAGGIPCIYARSYWPAVTERDQDWLDDLGERPLGDALFSHPAARRSPIEVALIPPTRSSSDEAIWARRSVFSLGGGVPLLVHEFFLPSLFGGG